MIPLKQFNKEKEAEFFNKLAEVLEKHFPKNKCKERSTALVLNAMANVFLKENNRAFLELIKALQTNKL